MIEAAAEELEVDAADLETDGRGNIHVKGAPSPLDHHARTWRSPPSSSRAAPSPAAASS